MLTYLSIQGLAIIESLTIELSDGFNVITGETGAGKSILIKGLNLLLGGKISQDLIRQGNDSALVSGKFLIPAGHPALDVMENLGLPLEEENGEYSVLIRRSFSTKGKTQTWTNDVPITQAVLREISYSLVDIFGQHENQKLTDVSHHLHLLDQFLPDKEIRKKVSTLFKETTDQLHGLQELVENYQSRDRDKDYLLFRHEELRKFHPTTEEYEALVEKSETTKNSSLVRDTLVKIMSTMEMDQGGSASLGRNLAETSRLLLGLSQKTGERAWDDLAKTANGLAHGIDDLNFELSRSMERFSQEEMDLDKLQERLAGYQDLFRKHKVSSISDLLQEASKVAEEINFLESAEASVTEKLRSLLRAVDLLKGESQNLTEDRNRAKNIIKKKVEHELRDLAMPGASVDIEFSPVKRILSDLNLQSFGEETRTLWASIAESLTGLSEGGAERASFLLSANVGEPLLPLNKIASGGELSRIMLALKKALAAGADVCVLVFDEIDAGISGKTADIVGKKLKDLSSSFQVVCISHLAQVAAYADSHFFVNKFKHAGRTETTISKLSPQESAKEIARLLSGPEITSPSLANAENLIERARGKLSS